MHFTGVAAPANADLHNEAAPTEQSPHPMTAPGPDGAVSPQPPYSKGVAPITLAQLGSFEIKAQTLFPTICQQSGFGHQVPRFAIRVVRDGQTVYQRRYSARETSLLQALTTANSWVRFRRRQERWEYIGSFAALSLLMFLMSL